MTDATTAPALERGPILAACPEGATACLILSDGTVFWGKGIGAAGDSVGEVCFNTSMTGYQEILTDPSYCRQIVTLTYPHIGNTGVNPEDEESRGIYAAGLVTRELPLRTSNWRSEQSLQDYLISRKVVGIAGIDTRRLTRILREKGAQGGALMAGKVDVDEALAAARAFPGLAGMDLAKVVSTERAYEWNDGVWKLGEGYPKAAAGTWHVVAYDYGVKHNILRLLADRGCRVTVVPV